MSAKKRCCKRCGKKRAKLKTVQWIIDRFQVEQAEVCSACAVEIKKANAQFSN